MGEIQHELPCGHGVSTATLLDRIDGFSSAYHRGSGICPDCGATWGVEFERMGASDGVIEWINTYLSTGQVEGGPGPVFVPHQRRRVRDLVVDGSVARLNGREWRLGSR